MLMTASCYQEILTLVDALSAAERKQLIAHLTAAENESSDDAEARPRWTDLIGTAPYPALGEDAQAWVTRTRRESDEAREAQWRERS